MSDAPVPDAQAERRAARRSAATTRVVRHTALALALVLGVTLAAATDASSASAAAPGGSGSASAWSQIDEGLARLGPEVGFLAARVSRNGSCRAIHAVAPSTARPTASQFKLFVLGALARQISSGKLAWDQKVTVTDAVKSLGNSPETGSLQFVPSGTEVSVEDAATKMISISDNTAADLLIGLVGRKAVEAQTHRWSTNGSRDVPFLTTKEMLLLHYVPGLGDRYLATPRGRRAAFLAASVDTLPVLAVAAGYSTDPRYIDQIEWFASPTDICQALAGLQVLSERPGLAPISTVMSRADFGIALDPAVWPRVWFKGGSESGVLTLGWLATNRHGETFVVEAMVANPAAALPASQYTDLTALAKQAFGLVGGPSSRSADR
jgi:beta-lactamase class A